jgi:hypothetical protein
MTLDCRTALDRLLEAASGELRGEGGSELAGHVRACPRCRAVADRLLQGQAGLARALAEIRPGRSVDSALEELPDERAIAADVRARGARRWAWLAPLAAAAALTGVLLLRDGGTERPSAVVEAPPVEAPPPRLPAIGPAPVTGQTPVAGPAPVAAPSARHLVVFETRDPSMTIIWISNGGA